MFHVKLRITHGYAGLALANGALYVVSGDWRLLAAAGLWWIVWIIED